MKTTLQATNENHQPCVPPKWFALIDDTPLAVPDPTVTVHVLKTQANVPADFVLVRDHNSPNDVVLKDGETVDLRQGNVFYTMPACEVSEREHCTAPAKLAITVDDRAEEIGTRNQTGGSIRELFELPDDTLLFRDLHSRDDQAIEGNAAADFDEGPVFYTRKMTLTVKVNNLPVKFTKCRVTALELKQTAMAQSVKIDIGCVLYRVKPGGGLGSAIADAEILTLKECDEFRCVAADDNS